MNGRMERKKISMPGKPGPMMRQEFGVPCLMYGWIEGTGKV
ncbi:MAG: hypothetical protein U0T74_00670 [Chitinophagales bacterium]